jgi:hypothetical protein
MFSRIFGKAKREEPAAEDVYFQVDNSVQLGIERAVELTYGYWPMHKLESADQVHQIFVREVKNVLQQNGLASPSNMKGVAWLETQAVYACCFQPRSKFDAALAQIKNPSLLTRLRALRPLVIDGKVADRAKYERIRLEQEAAQAAKKPGKTPAPAADDIHQMTPDDWHQIALTWNWDSEPHILWQIANQPNCDAATAMVIFGQADPTYYFEEGTQHNERNEMRKGNLIRIAKNLSNGFYKSNRILLEGEDVRWWREGAEVISAQRLDGINIPTSIFATAGKLRHKPSVSSQDGALVPYVDIQLKK